MTTYKIQERKSGSVIETDLTLAQAEQIVTVFEKTDKKAEGENWQPDFYEIVKEG